MKTIIVAQDKEHLEFLISNALDDNGNNCDLNHIDVSGITDMSLIFFNYAFNGNISEWDVSNVNNMYQMFSYSTFNGDISKWDVSSVKDMHQMFASSKFNGDISEWDVSNVNSMKQIFRNAQFKRDLSKWKPYSLKNVDHTFEESLVPIPYWAKIEDKEQRDRAIDNYWLAKELDSTLNQNNGSKRKSKI